MIVVKVPGINGLGKTKGCRNAGNAILKELENKFSNERGIQINVKTLALEEIHVDNDNLDEQDALIYQNTKELFESQDRVLFLGGDGSISFPIGRAFIETFSKGFLVVFDSHADCIKSGKHPTNREWLRALVEHGFPADNILLVGARNIEASELQFLKEKNIRKINIHELVPNIEDVTDSIMEFSRGKELYVSFDIDMIDSAFASATMLPEPGGLTTRQAVYIVSRIGLMKNLKAFDIVEVNSEKDMSGETVRVAAKLLAELL